MTMQDSLPRASNIARAELGNGIVLLAYENPAVQSVNLMGSLHAGSLYEESQQNGLASLTASALLTGTRGRSFEQLHSALEDNGADLGFRAHVHKLGFSGKALAEDLPLLIDVANDVLRNPVFPAEHVERLRGERLTWLQYSQFDTRYRASRAMREALYPANHAYHYSPSGSEATLAGLDVTDLAAFHAQHVGPRGMIIVVVGAVAADEALALAAEAFDDWRKDDQPPALAVAAPNRAAESLRQDVYVPGKTQADICMGIVGPARRADDFLAAQLANSVLGEFGMMGRIGKTVRERQGLAYYAFSRLGGGHGPEPWTISAGVNPDNVERAIASIRSEIQRLTSELVSKDDLADNQSYFTGRMPLQLESNEGIASRIHSMESYGLGLDYLASYAQRVQSIDRDAILAAARRYLSADNMVVAVAGPEQNGA
ncbi:MAG: insulinase family protein [Chloroflexi bacterium]|nr:insulinase family protein [Chloroflexota bacterium]MYA93947.1 insulinase family protein [Chloroflexota bacterium]MYC56383.1 insulinase family protein [Chloroflexota bacterium]MYD37853.1 insulinase family protein [Chloroflexota bacterium]MYH65271.1 insulinase family protein [Chloroflexota bacterium]